MSLYTRTGDDGSTGLFGGDRVRKDHPRVEAYGTVDEVNACLGLAITAVTAESAVESRMKGMLTELQSRLFDIGADLATPAGNRHESKITRIAEPHIAVAEGWIDEIDGANAPMRAFVLPGGSELAARLHHARCVCRRAERAVVALAHDVEVNPNIIHLLNRISDLLFAMARRANQERGVPDVEWHSPSTDEN